MGRKAPTHSCGGESPHPLTSSSLAVVLPPFSSGQAGTATSGLQSPPIPNKFLLPREYMAGFLFTFGAFGVAQDPDETPAAPGLGANDRGAHRAT